MEDTENVHSEDEESDGSEDGSDEEEEEKKENNSCISIYFQSKKHDPETAIDLQVMEQVIDDMFYDQLRNKE